MGHLVDVIRRTDVGFGGHHSAICKLAHATGVGHLHPFDGVHINAQIPRIHSIGMGARSTGKFPRQHQALDVVGIGPLKGLVDRIGQTGHLRVPGPEPLGKGTLMIEKVVLRIFGHARPIDPTHVFPPTEDLSDETLCLRNIDLVFSLSVFGFHRRMHLKGVSILQFKANDMRL